MRNLVLVEVKRTGTDLSAHQEQLLRYAFDEGAPLAVLTDGLVWWLYLPMVGGNWEQRRFSRTDLRVERPADTASTIHRFLNRDGIIAGGALEETKREFESQERDRLVRGALLEAWRQVRSDTQGLLPDLLSEAVKEISGHTPDRDTIAEFLQGISGGEGTEGDRLSCWSAAKAIIVRSMCVNNLYLEKPREGKRRSRCQCALKMAERGSIYWLSL